MSNGEIVNHEKSHRQFMNWTDWLVIAISIVVTIVLGIGGYTGVITEIESILSSLIAIFIGAVIILHKTSTKIMQNTITDLQNAIGEDINTIVALRSDFDTITTLLKDIIYTVTDKKTKNENIDRATKRLNGVKQILKQKMVDIETAKKASRRLKESKSSFYAVSTSTIAECFEPVFFEYFAEQICICKGKKSANKYLLSWDNVSGDDNEKLKRFLREYLDIDWVGNAEIHKSNGGRTIRIFNDENSVEIMRNDKGKKAILKIFANFSAERYFVYDHDIIEKYREELITFKHLHEDLGGIVFNVLDAKNLRSYDREVNNVLNKLDPASKEILEKSDNPFSRTLITSGYIPDFLLIDKNYVFPRDEEGVVKPSADQSVCDYYNALVEFFREASKVDLFHVPI